MFFITCVLETFIFYIETIIVRVKSTTGDITLCDTNMGIIKKQKLKSDFTKH